MEIWDKMNSSPSQDSFVQQDLILKLCNHFAKNDDAVASKLCKVVFSFLSASQCPEVGSTGASEEHYVVEQIKQMLSSKSMEEAQNFELLYHNICASSVLQNRCAVLSFLLKLAKTKPTRDPIWSTSIESLEKFPEIPKIGAGNKLNLDLRSGHSQESIKSIFVTQSNLRSFQSSATHIEHYSRSTVPSSSGWSRHDLSAPLSGKPSSADLVLITERDLLQDVIYTFQGIEGQYLKREPGGLGFIIDAKYSKTITPIQKSLVDRLVGISFLHNQVKQYCDSNDKQCGVICQALIATLRDELSDYYKTVALLQAGINLENTRMSLRKSLVYMYEHHKRFEWLAYIAEQCNDKKGGALITAIHGFLQHGSKCAREVSEKVLAAVCKPLFIMLSRWLLDGEINDPSNEFFIEARNVHAAERMWHDKYHVRRTMMPSFITMDQAKKILATGKSINFLRQICKDGDQLPGREALQKLFASMSVEVLFAPEQSLEFQSTLEEAYRKTSLRVLNLLKNKYRLFEHLQSLRRYLLLGQGDFIRHLLELLVPELSKPAQDIYTYNLSAILESAIRVTNAQFEDEDTLKRLHVSFMGHSRGDTGWDVFSLVYIVDGPVGTIFQPTMTVYQCLFGALWKAKRMEFVLANMRKQQIAMAKTFRRIKELKPVMHIIHILTSEMIHFLHQTQYYFLFEVLECSWAEMVGQVNQAECLDDIITAHNTFLNSVECGVFLDEDSRVLFSHLRSIYNFILTLESHQGALNAASTNEYNAFMEYKEKTEGPVGVNLQDELKMKERRAIFYQFLNDTKTKIKHLAQSYQEFVKTYLKLLSSSSNVNLQLLSVRLSFNDYYKII